MGSRSQPFLGETHIGRSWFLDKTSDWCLYSSHLDQTDKKESLLPLTMMVAVSLVLLCLTRAAFSSPWGSKEKAESEWSKEYDEPSFTSEPRNGGKYERRTYSPSTWACTNLTVDTAADPLAGLENVPFTQLMQSKRYKKKVPSSRMFWPLFRYIGGVNEGNIKIEMTKGVTTKHILEKKDKYGEIELQEMCLSREQVPGNFG